MSVKRSSRSIGGLGEKAAISYLSKNGYKVIRTNYRIGRLGEIDIIAYNGEYLCFIEVKTRKGNSYGAPCEAVTVSKQNTIRKIASIYLSNLGREYPVRFDVVEIIGSIKYDELEIKSLNLLKNAF